MVRMRFRPGPSARTAAIAGAICIAAVAMSGGEALAQSTVPPDSEVDQYVPSVPYSDGERGFRGERGSDNRDAVPEETVQELEALGAEGVAVAELAESTAPDKDREKPKGGGAADDESAVGSFVGTVSGDADGGLGILLPILLGATLVAAIVYAWRRRSLRRG